MHMRTYWVLTNGKTLTSNNQRINLNSDNPERWKLLLMILFTREFSQEKFCPISPPVFIGEFLSPNGFCHALLITYKEDNTVTFTTLANFTSLNHYCFFNARCMAGPGETLNSSAITIVVPSPGSPILCNARGDWGTWGRGHNYCNRARVWCHWLTVDAFLNLFLSYFEICMRSSSYADNLLVNICLSSGSGTPGTYRYM